MATRSWLRPSLRYGSTSTIPLARNTFAIVAASVPSAKSIVPTTLDRAAGSATNGDANSAASAHRYRRAAESAQRPVVHSRPPLPSIQSSCSASRNSVAMAGVLYVWSLSEFSSAVGSDRNSGTQRPLAPISATRSSATGLISASHSPPSEANDFCGAK